MCPPEQDRQSSTAIEQLARCVEELLPPNVALMQFFIATRDEEEARRTLEAAIQSAKLRHCGGALAKLQAMQDLWDRAPEAYSTIASIHDLVRQAAEGAADSRIDRFADLFDRAAAISPAAGVALYSLGEPRLLEDATQEIIARMREWKLFNAATRVIEIGCGAGRFLSALAPLVGSIIGIDISENMLTAARARVVGLSNVMALRGSGRDLSAAGAGPFDLVLAVDSFPYLVAADLVETHFAECARLLSGEGWLLIFNFSYRGDLVGDMKDVACLAARFGFSVLRNGTKDLALWDGTTFLLRRMPSC